MDTSIGLDARTIADEVRAGKLSAVDVLDEHLARIESHNDAINAMVFLDEARARGVAADVDAAVKRGEDPGPLAGVPLGIKELESVEGWPETRASTAFKDNIATHTTTMSARLLAAGAVPVGLTASPELGLLFFTNSVLHGVTRNPWNLERTPGGSSGGAAASLVAGLVALATGSDMGGSIRTPSACCGVVGVKGTLGRIPRGPGYLGGANLTHYGPLARSVGDAARYLDCAAGVDQRDPMSLPAPEVPFERAIEEIDLSGVRVAVLRRNSLSPSEPAVGDVVEAAATTLIAGTGLRRVDGLALDLPPMLTLGGALVRADWDPTTVDAMPEVMTNMMNTEGAADLLMGSFDPSALTIEGVAANHQARHAVNMAIASLFDEVDVILMPTMPMTAFGAAGPIPRVVDGEEIGPAAPAAFVAPFNFSGNPVVSVPAGFVDGLPVGMQIVARRHDDALALAVAARFEELHPWPKLAPSS
ncbi:MAG TPA: amidase [Acidimicrobiales bacterium]|nr:amidase [Acidimicrobiales bacterium]